MKTHGGRSFLKGHLFGDNVYDFLAPCIYEGEGEILGLAFFKSLVKEHGKAFFESIGKALQKYRMKTLNPANPLHAWRLRRELWAYSKWMMGQKFKGRDRQSVEGMDRRLQTHVDFALSAFGRFPAEISATMRKHQLKLPDRQCRMAELSQRIQDTVTILVTALWGHQKKGEVHVASADLLCQDLQRKLTGRRPDDRYYKASAQLADVILSGGYEELAGVPRAEITARRDHDALRESLTRGPRGAATAAAPRGCLSGAGRKGSHFPGSDSEGLPRARRGSARPPSRVWAG
jgi:hypothetical protein